jgi:5-methyltetrahydrofolate--homocysteine methyltransferase
MKPLLEQLLKERPIVTDGAWGTQIQSLGLEPGGCPDEWNLKNPGAIESVARSYVDAGSRIILTNTFGASRIMLERHGLSAGAAAINRAGAEISRKAAGDKALVFGSMGPSGKLLFAGEISEAELLSAFEEQAASLAEGGAHGIVIETMSELGEAVIALKAAAKTGLPVVVSMVYDSGKEFDRTMMGTTPEEASHELQEEGADVIGANCGMGIEFFLNVSRRLRAATPLPIWIKPNAGLPEMVEDKVIYAAKPEEFTRYAAEITAAGVQFIGGCCGTTPAFIKELASSLGRRPSFA